MNLILTIIESLIFLILSGIHFNWAIGGKFGLNNSLPTNEKGEKRINPKPIDSAIVGFGLLIFAGYFLVKGGLVSVHLPYWVDKYGGWVIASIFLLRAIGEFNYVGFFQKSRNTAFSKMDLKFYSPLCLILSLVGYYLSF